MAGKGVSCGVMLCALVTVAGASADVVVLDPIRDGTLYEKPDGTLANGAGEYMFTGRTIQGSDVDQRRAVLAFDIANNVPPGAVIESATLTLHMSRTIVGPKINTLHRILKDWGEGDSDAGSEGGDGASAEPGDATWLYTLYDPDVTCEGNPGGPFCWDTPGGDFSGTISASESVNGDGFYSWGSSAQMVADVQMWLDSPAANFGWLVKGDEATSPSAKRFDTREHNNASNRPQLVIVYGEPPTPPDVTVIAPNGGETIEANSPTTIEWIATDESGVGFVDLFVSDDNGTTYQPVAFDVANTGSYSWIPANRPTTLAGILVVATDNSADTGEDESDGVFTIISPPGGIVPTTLRDFDQPGTQPLEAGILNDTGACLVCHGNYDANVEPGFNWQGSMMAQASIDPLFEACMAVANQDAPDSGDLCLRCHIKRAWLDGRSVPTDGSSVLAVDRQGVACDFCHRMVDPIFDPGESPSEDEGILADLSMPPSDFGNGMYIVDPTGARRGPFPDANSAHPVLYSPFHREAALCGTCHDVSNPAFEKDGGGNYVPNTFDAMAGSFSPHQLAPIERTYSEWFFSEYNTPQGVFAPQFGGNLDFVSICQDCHMRDVTGEGCSFGSPPIRADLPLHDMTGGSTWLPSVLGVLYPGQLNEPALAAGILRARYMLQHAADMTVEQTGQELQVTITNNTGHKLPTGYPDGRRIWINVKYFDGAMSLIWESGAYDPATGVLTHDPEVKIYETEPGLDEVTAPLVGVDPGPSFHFVLNNKVFKDNRIPPRGFTNAAYADFGGAPVGHSYADGQYWDITTYAIPPGAATAEVTLYYQSTTKEFVEFLRDENVTNTKGQELYDLWNDNGKSPPEEMESAMIDLVPPCPGDVNGDGMVNANDFLHLLSAWGPNPGHPADFDDDGIVGSLDFLILLAAWGPCP